MITITDPPTLVKAAEPTAEPTAEIKHPTTHIDIYETMLSPFAEAAHAQCVANRLRALGWPATYQPIRPRWTFASYEEAARFRRDFDEILLHTSPPFIWPIEIYDGDEAGLVRDWVVTVAAVDVDTPYPAPWGVS